jgi:hypothetical protein
MLFNPLRDQEDHLLLDRPAAPLRQPADQLAECRPEPELLWDVQPVGYFLSFVFV